MAEATTHSITNAWRAQPKAKGLRPAHYNSSELGRMAEEYIQANRGEVIAEARKRCAESPKIADFFCADVTFIMGGWNMIVGYARVSTDGQTLGGQTSTLRDAGAERIYSEKISGVVTDRKALARAIAWLEPLGMSYL